MFYRTQFSALSLFSLLILGTSVPFGNWPLQLGVSVLLMKLVTYPVVWYLSGQMRPNQYWLYLNLHIAPWQLWAGVVLLDTGLFSGVVALLRQLVVWL
ncbi:hypothetical protein J0X19_19145 [Hymenobacter sp. BT186]|uniref:Uncharacterized protein n=1 Tax=Hymenobacter telluris TaxID=2816474 RepID=A0A939JE51_9BACT|nr:hypothetical protein [Hymenobacter telluris]MBO0360085.1 hypothetical protein [Hymenobacter telluris]MBW3376112.1 hypothetical protein [Hymenobacter norwichensis]